MKKLLGMKHLHNFDADWIKVKKSQIDFLDADCVYKQVHKQYFLWQPISWIHTYALTKVPLRGRQIAYNDSGEADQFIADVNDAGKIIWEQNKSDIAGFTSQQSFIRRMKDDQLGMFITTNKTSNRGEQPLRQVQMVHMSQYGQNLLELKKKQSLGRFRSVSKFISILL